MGTSVINALKYETFTSGEQGTRGQCSGNGQACTQGSRAESCGL